MKAPLIADAERDTGRDDGRDTIRARPREPHEKYQIDPSHRQKGMAYQWIATKVRGAQARSLSGFFRAGWRPTRAADHPELSDYGLYDQTLVDMGVVSEVKPDSPVILDDQMLVMRPAKVDQQAVREREARGRAQLDDHLRLMREKSERDIGAQRTRFSRTYGPNDIVPDDEEPS